MEKKPNKNSIPKNYNILYFKYLLCNFSCRMEMKVERVNLKIYQYKFSNLKDRKILFLVKNASETCWKIPKGLVYM